MSLAIRLIDYESVICGFKYGYKLEKGYKKKIPLGNPLGQRGYLCLVHIMYVMGTQCERDLTWLLPIQKI